MSHSFDGSERRKYTRFSKSYSLFFYFKESTDKKDATFIRDISKGGVRFTTSHDIKAGTHLVFEIGIPYIAPKRLILEGVVVAVRKISNSVYEIRAKFNSIDGETVRFFDMIEKKTSKGS